MSAEIKAEEGRQCGVHEDSRLRNIQGFLRSTLRRTLTLFEGVDDYNDLDQKAGVEMIHCNPLATKRLSVERVSQLVGSDVGCLNLKLAASDDGSSPEVEWNHSNIASLIHHCGTRVINAVNPAEMSFVHASIACNAIDCAEELFACASKENIPVVLKWAEDDILGWAIKSQKKQTVDFVLRKILGRCSTLVESARVIRRHFDTLLKKVPGIMEKFLEADSFCFEYGRFQVPAEVFERRAALNIFKFPDKYSIATHSADPILWKAVDSKEVKKFWMRNDSKFAEKMNTSAGQEVFAVSKFICINCPFHAQPTTLLSQLTCSKCSVEIFKNRTIETMAKWRWQISSRNKQLGLLAIHLVLALLFLMFAALYSGREVAFYLERGSCRNGWLPDESQPDQEVHLSESCPKLYLALLFLRICFILVWSSLGVLYEPSLLPYAANVSYLYYHCKSIQVLPNAAVILISVQCLLILISVLQALRPFRLTGPLVSMIYYTLWDIIPFLLLGALMIIWFGMAVTVTFTSSGVNTSIQFDAAHNSFEYLFYTMLGNFEDKVNFDVGYDSVAAWRTIVVSVFLALGAVVLLSLLIAALSDTFDRVMLSMEAESIKARAVASESRGFSTLYWILARLPFLRCYWRRPWQWFDADMTWIRLLDWLLLGCNRRAGVRHRRRQLQKLQDFADATCRPASESESAQDVLIFHFLVPAESDVDTSKRASWHGRILALVKLIERTFEKTWRSLDKHSDNTTQTMARIEEEMEAIKNRAEEMEREQRRRFDAQEVRMERMENNLRTQFEALLRRLDDTADASKTPM